MSLDTVGILSPGDMGHTVGQVLRSHGLRVIACLQDRSQRTRFLAQKAGIKAVPTYHDLVSQADLVLSILVPAQAKAAAQRVAQANLDAGASIVYADCNAIAPQTVRQVGEVITASGGHFVDASIIGPPPRKAGFTRFYASGPDVTTFEELTQFGLEVIVLDEKIGSASAIKMCYAALTKGLTALCTELLTAAQALGVSEALHREFQTSQADLYARMERGLPHMPPKSRRFVGEMEEISKTFGHVGLTPKIHAGAAEVYRFVGATSLADRTPEDSSPPPSLSEMLGILSDYLDREQAQR
jgi:3-hydroxyisobutyrate dehydrogenase-like beta-hydroxyacid dehydrogenase